MIKLITANCAAGFKVVRNAGAQQGICCNLFELFDKHQERPAFLLIILSYKSPVHSSVPHPRIVTASCDKGDIREVGVYKGRWKQGGG